jgi:hypothetical protein
VLNKISLQKYLHNPGANLLDESNEVFDHMIMIIVIVVANHELIRFISFVVQSYTHILKGFVNKHHLVLHAWKIRI